MPTNVALGSTKFKECAIKDLTCSFVKMNRGENYVQVPARAVYTPVQNFRECRDAFVIVYLCTEFGVSSLNFTNSEDPRFIKCWTLWHVLLARLSTSNRNGRAYPLVLSAHEVWAVSVHRFGRQPWKSQKRCQFFPRTQHVQCALQVNFLYCVVMPLSMCRVWCRQLKN